MRRCQNKTSNWRSVSGGDPLTLPMAKLRWFVNELAAIEHLDVIRIGTRVPVTLPRAAVRPRLAVMRSAGDT